MFLNRLVIQFTDVGDESSRTVRLRNSEERHTPFGSANAFEDAEANLSFEFLLNTRMLMDGDAIRLLDMKRNGIFLEFDMEFLVGKYSKRTVGETEEESPVREKEIQ